MALVLDPVGSGLVKSLAHPGGNVTGLSMMATELYPKRLQLLKEINPQLAQSRSLVESRPPIPCQGGSKNSRNCALAFDRTEFCGVRTPSSLMPAFSDINRASAQALYVVEDPIFFAHRMALLNLASMARLPTIHELARWPEAGALISYGRTYRTCSVGRPLRWPHSQRRSASRSAGGTADQIRTGHQSQDCHGSRPRRAAAASAGCR